MVKNKNFVYTDSDLSPVSNLQTKIHDQDDTLSQDLTLTSNGSGSLSWLAGATYYRERATRTVRTRGGLLEIGREHVRTTVTNAHHDCRLLHENKISKHTS